MLELKEEITPPRKKQHGYKTYLMLDENTGYIKIGKSHDPSFREATLGAQTPKIKTLFILEKDIEADLHRAYCAQRVRGEWFDLSMDEVLDIANTYEFKAKTNE